MGEVFRVWDRGKKSDGALKLIIRGADDEYRDRFIKEARIAVNLEGEHIAKLIEFAFCEDQTPFAVWEYIPGRTLAAVIGGKPMDPKQALKWMDQLTAGLSEMHRQAIHRDIKPLNLMIRDANKGDDGDNLVILDFGLAKPLGEPSSSRAWGTPHYMAPELFDDPPPDPRPAQDIYAAGIVMYELLMGHPPYRGSMHQLVMAIQEGRAVWGGPVQRGSQLHAIIRRAIDLQWDRRFSSAEEFRSAIQEALPSVMPPPPPPTPVVPAFDEFRTWLAAMGATVEPMMTDEVLDPDSVRVPKFMLFKRAREVVMAIVPDSSEIDPLALQKTNEPKASATMLRRVDMEKLGFAEDQVHPIFHDPTGQMARLIVDAIIVAQAELFPDSLLLIPLPDEKGNRKMLVPCYAFLRALRRLHGDRLIYGNITQKWRKRWKEDVLFARLLEQRSLKTRFAPTPSGTLHMGNARTALAAYLQYRCWHKSTSEARFHIRIDDTDPLKSRPEFIEQIQNDLCTLGIDWKQYEYFKQSEIGRYETYYQPLVRLLAMAGLVINDVATTLKSRWPRYQNLWLDWRDGPTIDHEPPMSSPHTEVGGPLVLPSPDERPAKRLEKHVKLMREMGGTPFYRYAGVVDDILPFAASRPDEPGRVTPVTYVIRDNTQRGLTSLQGHIRAALEEARSQLAERGDGDEMFRRLGLDQQRPLPLPIYLHLPLVVSAGGVRLSKSAPDDEYLIGSLLRGGILQEALVAYLIWTLVSRPRTGREPLDEIVDFTGRYGVECAIARFAEEFDPFFLTQAGEHPITCDLHLLRKANVRVIRAMLPWTFGSRLVASVPDLSGDFDAAFRLFQYRQYFADWNQVVAVARGPLEQYPISAVTASTIATLQRRLEPMRGIQEAVQHARMTIKNTRRTTPTVETQNAMTLLSDFRLLLTGAERSPQIQHLLGMLDEETVRDRLGKAQEWQTT